MNKAEHLRIDKFRPIAFLWRLSLVFIFILTYAGEAAAQAKQAGRTILPDLPSKGPQPAFYLPSLAKIGNLQEDETFYDSFESNTGWAETEKERYSTGLREGEVYQISFWQAGDENYTISFQPHRFKIPLRNMVISVWGAALNSHGAYGLVCRYKNSDNFYTFHISTDGRYWLYKRVKGKWTNLGTGTNPAITEENTMALICIDKRISASVNDEIIAEANDSSLKEGNAGLFAQPLGGQLEGAWSYYAVFDMFEMTVQP